ncbi:hypothetical protein SAMN04489752_1710 [Brevibacterium siliguriense]|uniref:Uncharacterized protein n=1 Tax=Brevibacterium siliguriense TaxID=1136497 RepID=A0A1H1S6I4_9MICO|nr:hypothetical protein [Brevibacterium siliguriense]SDS43513.1 hypothetical protein SAMN04489752_1710 [Brevibacterium siliguriense]
MAKTFVHATVTLDGFMADPDGGIGWMEGLPAVDEDFAVVREAMDRIGPSDRRADQR